MRVIALSIALGLVAPSVAAMPRETPPRVATAVKSSIKSDRELGGFYAARGNRPLWVRGEGLGPEATQLLALVASADLDGVDPRAYKPQALAKVIDKARGGSPKALAKAEAMLSRTLVNYVRHARSPRDVGIVYLDRELAPGPPTASAILAAAAPDLQDYLASKRWMHPLYAGLRDGLAASRGSGSGAVAPAAWIPPGAPLKAGAGGERVRLLRQRLGLWLEGDFDSAVASALRDFQAEHDLPVDGVAGPRTLAALNERPQDRARTIQLNLERARALPGDARGRYILVDAAAARLWLYENGEVRDTMRVIVGKPSEPTPMLAGLMRYAIVNPYWNVPPDLARARVAPEVLRKGPAYLKAMRYEVLSDWSDTARVLDPKKIDWAAVAAGRREVRVRQLPGKGNSMGKMKFMMPNNLGIYLHDTPDKELFAASDRRFSAGCVRVEDAQRLARWLFGRKLAARSSAPEQRVDLPAPVPVYITYLTAAPTANGLVYRSDAYGRDRGAGFAGAR